MNALLPFHLTCRQKLNSLPLMFLQTLTLILVMPQHLLQSCTTISLLLPLPPIPCTQVLQPLHLLLSLPPLFFLLFFHAPRILIPTPNMQPPPITTTPFMTPLTRSRSAIPPEAPNLPLREVAGVEGRVRVHVPLSLGDLSQIGKMFRFLHLRLNYLHKRAPVSYSLLRLHLERHLCYP